MTVGVEGWLRGVKEEEAVVTTEEKGKAERVVAGKRPGEGEEL